MLGSHWTPVWIATHDKGLSFKSPLDFPPVQWSLSENVSAAKAVKKYQLEVDQSEQPVSIWVDVSIQYKNTQSSLCFSVLVA